MAVGVLSFLEEELKVPEQGGASKLETMAVLSTVAQ